MTWTDFHDMHSGGDLKEPPYGHIYVELPEQEAREYFEKRFGHCPDRVTCDCCGADYSVTEGESLEKLTQFERGCTWAKRRGESRYFEGEVLGGWMVTNTPFWPWVPFEEYVKSPFVLFIHKEEINEEED